jgi:hypothetical protein
MYLAPLNYDRFFKRVFSHEHIAKRFLEDFLNVTITDFETLPHVARLTDDGVRVELDFRCRIEDKQVIIDMQQWYKTDVIKRFYAYHTAGTIMQLERALFKKMPSVKSKKARVRNYDFLKPVITLIWMVDDTLQSKENFVNYTMVPDKVLAFIANPLLWETPLKEDELLEAREKVLKITQNECKGLDFIGQNQLCFIFQQNIVENPKIEKYHKWFRFAEKTRYKENESADFDEFKKDEVFLDMMRLISKEEMNQDDLKYLVSEEQSLEEIERYDEGVRNEGRKEGEKIGEKRGERKGEKKGRKAQAEFVAMQMIKAGESDEKIMQYTELEYSTVQLLRKFVKYSKKEN